MTTQTLNVIFDGSTDVARLPGQSSESWNDASLGYYNVYYSAPGPGDDLNATANFTGSGWRVKTLRIAGDDNLTTIRDLSNGADRRVDLLELGYNSDVELISTRVRFIYGWDGDRHEVKLGSQQNGNTSFIGLYAKENIVTTGNVWVASIETGGDAATAIGDTIRIGNGGAGSVNTGQGDDTVTTTGGFVRSIATNDGNDTVKTGSNFVHSIAVGAGNDVVRTGSVGGHSIDTYLGNDKVYTSGGFIASITTGAGKDLVKLGAGGAGSIDTGDDNDRVIVSTGSVDLIETGGGNDTVILGKGGAGVIRARDGNDTIIVKEQDGNTVVTVQGGNGNDTLSFKPFKTGVTFSLDEFGQFQNVSGKSPTDLTPAKGWFGEIGIENLIGGNRNDRLTGDDNANKLTGNKGNDILVGLGGNDLLRGNAGADVFVFGANGGTDTVADFQDGTDILRIGGHSGGFSSLDISKASGDMIIEYDGGTIVLDGAAQANLTRADFDFI